MNFLTARLVATMFITTVFVDTRPPKTKHPQKRFLNFCQSYMNYFIYISNHTCYRQIGSKSTNHSPLAGRKEGLKVTLVAVIGGFRSDLSITCKTDGSSGNVSTGVLFSKVAYQRKR